MLGAIFGDIVGSVFEFHPTRDMAFPLLSEGSKPTDDTFMTLAVAQALMETKGQSGEVICEALVRHMRSFGRRYPNGSYGGMFSRWLHSPRPQPYHSFGNGSAMRVSAVGWMYPTLDETLHVAELTAKVTHDHPEGIKGAAAIASAIYLARNGADKTEIKEYIMQTFQYDLNRSLDAIRPNYRFDETCQHSVPEAILCFLEGKDYEEVIRLAVTLGGDSDTLACMAGGVAEAYAGMPNDFKKEAMLRLDPFLQDIVKQFESSYRLG